MTKLRIFKHDIGTMEISDTDKQLITPSLYVFRDDSFMHRGKIWKIKAEKVSRGLKTFFMNPSFYFDDISNKSSHPSFIKLAHQCFFINKQRFTINITTMRPSMTHWA